ncbi:MAG: DUF59 domain-containing protein, partial [Rhodobacteraceae bacterium]|nr:DUF59 domain-containing protein [Paracoccaceae bacterium]
MSLTREQVLEALKNIAPEGGTDIVTSGVMRALNIDGASVRFVMEIDPHHKADTCTINVQCAHD